MNEVEVTAADIESVRGGQSMFLPLRGGGMATLIYVGNVYRLTPTGENVTIEAGETPGEGAAAETPPA